MKPPREVRTDTTGQALDRSLHKHVFVRSDATSRNGFTGKTKISGNSRQSSQNSFHNIPERKIYFTFLPSSPWAFFEWWSPIMLSYWFIYVQSCRQFKLNLCYTVIFIADLLSLNCSAYGRLFINLCTNACSLYEVSTVIRLNNSYGLCATHRVPTGDRDK